MRRALAAVVIMFVPDAHPVWGPPAKSPNPAKALWSTDGRREIYIRAGWEGHPDLQGWIDHERAHLDAWDRYGPRIAVHGPEWKRACRKRVKKRRSYFCKGF